MAVISSLVDWAQATFEPYGVVGLIVLAFTEAIFSPVPPDVLLPVLAKGQPWSYAVYLGVVTTVASVAGGAIGYWVGKRFSPWVKKRYGGPRMQRIEAWYQAYGEWVVLLAGFTPIPFKIFTVTSGFLGLRFWPFILASFAGRGLRFVPEALLAAWYGDQVLAWLDRYELPALVATVILLVGLWWYTRHRNRDRSQAPPGSTPDQDAKPP